MVTITRWLLNKLWTVFSDIVAIHTLIEIQFCQRQKRKSALLMIFANIKSLRFKLELVSYRKLNIANKDEALITLHKTGVKILTLPITT